MTANNISKDDVKRIAELARLSLGDEEMAKLSSELSETISYIDILTQLNSRVENLGETYEVSGLSNVFRDDEIDESRMLSQEQALSNAKNTYRGYFMVSKIL